MLASRSSLLEKIDGWTSHSYPNPGFAASPHDTSKQSIRGFEHELAFLKNFSQKDFDVYITETGWKRTPKNEPNLEEYYTYAIEEVWSHQQVKAVTPFVFQANAGPFQPFSFINQDGSPTTSYLALKKFKPTLKSQFSQLLQSSP